MQKNLEGTPQGKAFLGVINAAGGPQALASTIGVSKQVVDNWIYLSKRVSREGALAIEAVFDGVTKEQLRPDVADWDAVTENRDLMAELASTPRGRGLLLVLSRVKNSRKALANLLGLSSPSLVKNWIARGYLPKQHVKPLLGMDEFKGLTAEMIRPDLHELDY